MRSAFDAAPRARARDSISLRNLAQGRDVLLVGNGPSRVGMSSFVHVAAQRGAFVIGCNAYWRESLPQPDVLACFDALQTRLALERCPGQRMLVPEQRMDCVRVELTEAQASHVFEATPHEATATADRVLDSAWMPGRPYVGNLVGLLAYQLALILQPRSVHLLGIDCCGKVDPGSDQVALSAIDGRTPGYGPALYPRDVVDPRTGMPRYWDQHLDLWRALTRRASDFGIPTFRCVDAGALTWLEVSECLA